MRTEQQLKIEQDIFELLNSSKSVVVDIKLDKLTGQKYFNGDSVENKETSAFISGKNVIVSLFTEDDLSKWSWALEQAMVLLEELKEEQEHAENNPNFFKALNIKLSNFYFNR